MAACSYFGVDLRNQLDHNFPSRLTDRTPYSSSHLLSSSPSLPFAWPNYSESNSFSLFHSLGQNYSKFNSSSPFFSDKYIPSQNSVLSFLFLDSHFYVQLHSYKKFQVNLSLRLRKISSLLTYFILLPLKSKQCPLTPPSVLTCADSVDELRFPSKSAS